MIFFNLLLNIGLLVLIATLLTRFSAIRQLFLEEGNTPKSRVALAFIFASVSILSTYTGIRTNGAIVNTRVIGVLAAGLLGGPYVGIGAALIAAVHRYLFDIGGFTALPCMISTIVEGLIGAGFSRSYREGKVRLEGIFWVTALAEIGQMNIILLLARPFLDAVELVKIIAAPMVVMNSVGMIIFITSINRVFVEQDSEYAEKIRLAFDIADRNLPYFREGLYNIQNMKETVRIIHGSFPCTSVMITDTQRVLSVYPPVMELEQEKESALIDMVASARNDRVAAFSECDPVNPLFEMLKKNTVIIASLKEEQIPVGSLVMVIRKKLRIPKATLCFVQELAKLFSTQLELSGLEYQKSLRRKAEINALQSQVNPHFLYNALNTVACVCRENPERARELIYTLSDYYRQTLADNWDNVVLSNGSEQMVSLHDEIDQVNRYLELEHARYEEKLVTELSISEDTDCLVPAFILQPLVENAVKHGADREGRRYVRIQVEKLSETVMISVTDHGKGFSKEVALCPDFWGNMKGIGLKNVHLRLKAIFKAKSGLLLENTARGAVVSFSIPCGLEEEEA